MTWRHRTPREKRHDKEPARASVRRVHRHRLGDKQKHDVCLTGGPRGPEQRAPVLEHDLSQIAAWASRLKRRFKGGPIAVCLELSRGPLVSALLEHDIFVVFPVNPQSLAKYRQTFAPSGAKDDPSDAEFALDFLVRHRDRLRPLKLESTTLRMVREMVVSAAAWCTSAFASPTASSMP
ncbi:MAG: transposase [Polyangiaceae bacterium]